MSEQYKDDQVLQTKNKDGTIKSEFTDPNNTGEYATSPNTETSTQKSNTGSGIDAAIGTTYDWNKKGDERAELNYKSDVLNSKSDFLTNKQTIQSEGQTNQEQYVMQEYAQNQSKEKAGWTGGYALDTERQVNYLKQTIAANMYGQMELQKYGYDTSLAAARLAYDTNRYDLALEYYNTALSRAISEAEITGQYVAPEVSEHLNDYSIASKTMNDPNASEEDKQRADKILTAINAWFNDNGISKEGVRILSAQNEDRTNKQAILSTYEFINDEGNQISADTFAELDNEGNIIYKDDGTDIKKINIDKMSTQELLDYIYDTNGTMNTYKQDQYLSRLDQLAYETENGFSTWCKSQKGLLNEDGSFKSTANFEDAFKTFIKSSDFTNKVSNEISRILKEDADQVTKDKIKEIINGWSTDIVLPDGSPYTIYATAVDNNGSSGSGVEGTSITKDEAIVKGLLSEDQKTITNADGQEVKVNYLEDMESFDDLMSTLNIQEIAPIADLLTKLDLSNEKALSDSLNNWQQYVKLNNGEDIPYVSQFLNMVNTLTQDLTVGAGVVTDQIQAQKFKDQVKLLTDIQNTFSSVIGETNMTLLRDSINKYNTMEERDINSLTETEKANYEKAKLLVEKLDAVQKSKEYAENHDSGMFTDSWDYIADTWKTTAENWDDGYQFGDVTRTGIAVIENINTTVASAIVGGFKWLIGLGKKKK